MIAFIILIFVIVIYFVFLKKGYGGKSFYQHKKALNKSIAEEGGIEEIYKEFIDYFMVRNFKIDKKSKTRLDLKYSSNRMTIEVQILQVNFNDINFSIQKRRNGETTNAGIRIDNYDNLKEKAEKLLKQGLTEEEINEEGFTKKSTIENTGLDVKENNLMPQKETSDSEQTPNKFPKDFKKYINYFKEADFKVIESKSYLVKLKLDTQIGVIFFSISIIDKNKIRLTLISELPKATHSVSIYVKSKKDHKSAIKTLVEEFGIVGSSYHRFKDKYDFLHAYEENGKIFHLSNSLFFGSNGYKERVYNKDSILLSSSEYSINSDYYTKIFYHYDENERLIKKTSDEKSEWGVTSNRLIEKFDYDVKGNLLRESNVFNSDKLEASIEHVYLYDVNNNIRYHKFMDPNDIKKKVKHNSISKLEPQKIKKDEIAKKNLKLRQFNENGDIIRKVYVEDDKLVIEELADKEDMIGLIFEHEFKSYLS